MTAGIALGIASVLSVSVVQRTLETGILRAMGARQQQVLRVLLIQGAVFGLAGSVLGGIAGYGLVSALSTFDPKLFFIPVDAALFVGAMALAALTGILSAAAPTRRAAALDPVEAIHHV